MAQLESYTVGFNAGIVSIQGTWKPSEEERAAAWEMYIELVTRVPVAELRPGEGLLRESLSSVYSLFGITRQILREHGPSIAQPTGEDQLSFGYIAVAILNASLRPLLAKWHPLLLDYESLRDAGTSRREHEQRWEQAEGLRAALNDVRLVLCAYAAQLELIIGISPSLMIDAISEHVG